MKIILDIILISLDVYIVYLLLKVNKSKEINGTSMDFNKYWPDIKIKGEGLVATIKRANGRKDRNS